jgi:hypothetical protein
MSLPIIRWQILTGLILYIPNLKSLLILTPIGSKPAIDDIYIMLPPRRFLKYGRTSLDRR